MSDFKDKLFVVAIIGGPVALLIAAGVGWAWYTSKVQADVYRRQGVEMSTWEVFIGAKPAERTVNLKVNP